ncbi:MAG: hypothetical protein D6760_01060 [Deltaproteobacteria bacterium]|nr:MAG: hypothetical protein D6760_01060 [Deltaproteobacteria bacterium]
MPPLSDQDIDRYARQIIIPGIGAAGQERLMETKVCVCGHPDGEELARRYLAATGLSVCSPREAKAADVLVLSDPGWEVAAQTLPQRCPVVWYRLRGETLIAGTAVDLAAALAAAGEPEAPEPTHPAAAIRHAIAACDAAASVVALALGWTEPGSASPSEVSLG